MVGADYSDAGGQDAGKVLVYSGQYGALLHTFIGVAAGDHLGRSVSSAGDVNNDGTDDIILGAFGYNTYTGRVYVYSGRDWALLYMFTGETTLNDFGRSFRVPGMSTGTGTVMLLWAPTSILLGATLRGGRTYTPERPALSCIRLQGRARTTFLASLYREAVMSTPTGTTTLLWELADTA